MKAAVYYGPADIRLEDWPELTPQTENLIVEVVCCAICRTDLKLDTVANPRCHPPGVISHGPWDPKSKRSRIVPMCRELQKILKEAGPKSAKLANPCRDFKVLCR